uniref:Uncharacterized protein n=1 Tax=Cucumis melo TaxID=3656 RepID=A0A9I9DC79_CUCME
MLWTKSYSRGPGRIGMDEVLLTGTWSNWDGRSPTHGDLVELGEALGKKI